MTLGSTPPPRARLAPSPRRRMSPQRRVRLLRTVVFLVVIAAVLGLLVYFSTRPKNQNTLTPAGPAATSSAHADTSPTASASATSPTTPSATPSATPTAVRTTPSASATVATAQYADVFSAPAVASYLAADGSQVTAAVYNAETGQLSLFHPTLRYTTASIIKVDILETLLAHRQVTGVAITGDVAEDTVGMIEASDNDDATELWDLDGATTGVGAYNKTVPLTSTVLDSAWGLSTTSAADQVRLVDKVAFANSLLTAASRAYALNLMTHIEAGEDWGVSGGVPAGVSVALKNGWDPINGIWQVNSIGWIHGEGRNYVVAVLSGGHSTEAAGITTIEGLSARLWTALAPA